MRYLAIVVSLVLCLGVKLAGCQMETTEGLGRDVQKLGSKIENA